MTKYIVLSIKNISAVFNQIDRALKKGVKVHDNKLLGEYTGEVDYCNVKDKVKKKFVFNCTKRCRHNKI